MVAVAVLTVETWLQHSVELPSECDDFDGEGGVRLKAGGHLFGGSIDGV